MDVRIQHTSQNKFNNCQWKNTEEKKAAAKKSLNYSLIKKVQEFEKYYLIALTRP